jgi:flagellar operon protein (TIGR03826 family)
MGELANCPTCGALFVKGVRTVCEKCYKEEEAQFQKVYEYIRKKENRTATLPEVAEATEVEQRLIMKFVKQKRIHTAHFPNLGYECDRCGTLIREGKICNSCRDKLKADLSQEEKLNSLHSELNKEKSQTYFAVDRKFSNKN